MDELARLACAGKPTIYARFPIKEALFTTAVIGPQRRYGILRIFYHPQFTQDYDQVLAPRLTRSRDIGTAVLSFLGTITGKLLK
jgi:hypothetical protein